MRRATALIAGTLLFSWLLLRGVPLPPRSLLPPIAVTGMLLLFCGNCLVTWAELTVPSGMAAVIVANLPFFVAAIEAGRKDGERLSGTGVLGLVIGFAGMLVLMWPKLASSEHHGLGDFRGELALLGATNPGQNLRLPKPAVSEPQRPRPRPPHFVGRCPGGV